jgi:hypothetical protein
MISDRIYTENSKTPAEDRLPKQAEIQIFNSTIAKQPYEDHGRFTGIGTITMESRVQKYLIHISVG